MRKFILKTKLGFDIPAVLEDDELIYGVTAVAIGLNNNYYEVSEIGKIKDDFAVHPKTNEKLVIVAIQNEKLNKQAEMIVPAHVQVHFDLAQKYSLPFKQVVAPYFLGKGEEALNPNSQTQFRRSVIAVIQDPENKKYLCVSAKKRHCNSFVMGGIEGEETPEEAADREVNEETGYCDIEITRKSIFVLHNHFYAKYKGVNRYTHLYVVFGKLKSEKQNLICEEESSKQKAIWLLFDELENFLSVNNNIFVYKNLMFGDNAYEGDGMMINSFELNNKLRSEVKIMENNNYIGKEVSVKIDRPLGTKHPKHGFIYPVNYGFIPNTVSGDGEELDAYVLGVFEPVESFDGQVIAIIHRTNDDDDKLIVTEKGKNYSDDQIRALTEFQERWFESIIVRK